MPSRTTATGGRMICAKCEVPANLTSAVTLSPAGEPGEPLEITGVIFQRDGGHAAAGVVMFVYHTDATGHYDPEDDPFAPRLRGWLRTGADGRYRIRTIRPAPYPNHSEPAHIHVHLWSDTMPEHFIDEFWFDGDPIIKSVDAARFKSLGSFSPIVVLTQRADGVWHGVRDIRLDR
ncbi:MAG TPA: hypothetical protein VF219_00660 [Vicinamibacterales bacterium]